MRLPVQTLDHASARGENYYGTANATTHLWRALRRAQKNAPAKDAGAV